MKDAPFFLIMQFKTCLKKKKKKVFCLDGKMGRRNMANAFESRKLFGRQQAGTQEPSESESTLKTRENHIHKKNN